MNINSKMIRWSLINYETAEQRKKYFTIITRKVIYNCHLNTTNPLELWNIWVTEIKLYVFPFEKKTCWLRITIRNNFTTDKLFYFCKVNIGRRLQLFFNWKSPVISLVTYVYLCENLIKKIMKFVKWKRFHFYWPKIFYSLYINWINLIEK